MPTLLGGEAPAAPRESATPPAFPAVHDMPPTRSVPVMTEAEQKQAEAELVAARDKQIGAPAKPEAQKKSADKKATEKKQQTAAKQPATKQPAPTTASNDSQSGDPR